MNGHINYLTDEKRKYAEDNLGLANSRTVHAWKKYPFAKVGVQFEDVMQSAREALTRAVLKFDATRGVQFSSYATTVIDNELLTLYRAALNYATETNDYEDISSQAGPSGIDDGLYEDVFYMLEQIIKRKVALPKELADNGITIQMLLMMAFKDIKPRDIAKKYNVNVETLYNGMGQVRRFCKENKSELLEVIF